MGDNPSSSQDKEAASGGEAAQASEKDSGETEQSSLQTQMTVTSDEVNYLIYRYLQESGFVHSAFSFAHESMLGRTGLRAADKSLPPGALITFLQKGLQYVGIEEGVNHENAKRKSSLTENDADFSLLSPSAVSAITRTDPPIQLNIPPATAAAAFKAKIEAEAKEKERQQKEQESRANSSSAESNAKENATRNPPPGPDAPIAVPVAAVAPPAIPAVSGVLAAPTADLGTANAAVEQLIDPSNSLARQALAAQAAAAQAAALSQLQQMGAAAAVVGAHPLGAAATTAEQLLAAQQQQHVVSAAEIIALQQQRQRQDAIALVNAQQQQQQPQHPDVPSSIASRMHPSTSNALPVGAAPTTADASNSVNGPAGGSKRPASTHKIVPRKQKKSKQSGDEADAASLARMQGADKSSDSRNDGVHDGVVGRSDGPKAMDIDENDHVEASSTQQNSKNSGILPPAPTSARELKNGELSRNGNSVPTGDRHLDQFLHHQQLHNAQQQIPDAQSQQNQQQSQLLPQPPQPLPPPAPSQQLQPNQQAQPQRQLINGGTDRGRSEPTATTSIDPTAPVAPDPGDVETAAGQEEVLQLQMHESEVFMCSWNPVFTNLIATGSGDASARIWEMVGINAKAGLRSVKLLPHGSDPRDKKNKDVTTLEWSSDGQFLATGSYDGVARVWSRNGALLHTLRKHTGPIFSLKWNREGNYILSGSYDTTTIVWDVSGHRPNPVVQQFTDHEAPALDVDWRDNNTFASCSTDKTVHIYQIGNENPLRVYTGHTDEVNAVKWDPSRMYLASCSDDCTAKVWSFESSSTDPLYNFASHSQEIYTVKWSPSVGGTGNASNRSLLATASFDGTVRLWSIVDGSCFRIFKRHRDSVYSVAFSPSGEYLASGSLAGQMYIWNIAQGHHVKSYKGTGDIFEVAWNKEETRVAACFSSNVVAVIDFDRAQVEQR